MTTVQFAQMPGDRHMMPTGKQGTDFLASSHFKIAQDGQFTEKSLKSIFKQDYIPWQVNGRPAAAKPPNPAEVLHRDSRYFTPKGSETSAAFPLKSLKKEEMAEAQAKLSKTNFKMDKDLTKFDSFHTTHSIEFPAKPLDQARVTTIRPMHSSIPQGDPEKALQPMSDYRDRYQSHSQGKPVKAGSMHQGGPPTITGDGRLHHFDTTHNEVFKGKPYSRQNPFPAPVGSNIPQGDQDKEVNMHTTHQKSFPAHDSIALKPYNKNAVMGKLQQTNFHQQDGHSTWDTYLSTMSEAYQPSKGDTVRSAPARHRNHSDFPEGDRQSWRNQERANMTTNRFYLGTVQTPHANIVSGANKRTKSNVWFGEPRLGEDFYETTVDSTFLAPTLPPARGARPDFNTKSAVPLNYYPEEKNHTTTFADFQNPRQGKTLPNPRAIDNLKMSHIKAPLGGERAFGTEHLDQYTAKSSRRVMVDAGRLQRSTVPLGTLNIK